METQKSWWIFGLWLMLSAITVCIWLYVDGWDVAVSDGEKKFESLNSLFAGLAFVGMICTLYMQKQELELQRQELRDTRKELAETKEETRRLAEATVMSTVIESKKHRLHQIETLLNEKNKNLTTINTRIANMQKALHHSFIVGQKRLNLENKRNEFTANATTLQTEIHKLEEERQALLGDVVYK